MTTHYLNPSDEPRECPACDGTGTYSSATIFRSGECSYCHGTGRIGREGAGAEIETQRDRNGYFAYAVNGRWARGESYTTESAAVAAARKALGRDEVSSDNLYEARARAAKADKLFTAAVAMGITAEQAETFTAYQRSLVAGIAQVNEPSDATWLHVCALLRSVKAIEQKLAGCDKYCTGPGDPFCRHNHPELDIDGAHRDYLDAVDGKRSR